MMHPIRFSLTLVLGTVLISLATASPVVAQEEAGHCPGKLEALNAAYARQLCDVARRWIAELGELADRSDGPEAEAAYRQLFNLAIAHDLCREAQAAARTCLSSISSGKAEVAAESRPPCIPSGQDLRALAASVQLLARAENGEYEQSLADVESLFKSRGCTTLLAAETNTATALAVGEAYLQRLIRDGRYDVGRKLCELACKDDAPPALKNHFEARMVRLDLLGKPAPVISGTDVDGHQVSLADLKGKVVLVDLRQPCCSRCAASIAASYPLAQKYHRQGLVILNVDVEPGCRDFRDAQTALEAAGRFQPREGVKWINLLDRQTMGNVTTAYGVKESAASFLIGRDGRILAVEQSSDALDRAILRALGSLTGGHPR